MIKGTTTQLQLIKEHLIVYGEISRNWCLARYISRLGARINDLKKKGWSFETETRNGDYFYIAHTIPANEKVLKREVPEKYRREIISPIQKTLI